MSQMYTFLQQAIHSEFDHLRVLRRTGEKSVTLLRHRGTGARYVLRTFAGDIACYDRLIGIRSACLPQILEAAAMNGQAMVLEEYIEGDSLYEMLREAVFSESETVHIVSDLCHALYILHSMGIVHRDVKPENILLRGGHAVLLDFDSARIRQEDLHRDTHALGTVGYAPPEQFGIGQTDGRSDIYALGVTMNVMLTGKHPSVQAAGGPLGRIVTRCTMTQPERRYQEITGLLEDIVGCMPVGRIHNNHSKQS